MRDAGLARAHQGCAVASLAWSSGGGLYVTVVVKATLALRDGGPAALVTAAPVEPRDRFLGREQASSLLVARELFPYRPRVDVTLIGHAHLPSAGVGAVRLALAGDGGWIDKTLEVRPPPSRGRTRSPALRVPLTWEGTWADEDNTLGVPSGVGAQAWIVDPGRPGAAIGLGPLPPTAPRRSAALRGIDPRVLDEDAPRIPEGFDWEHFQIAPADQQLGWLTGTERLELQGFFEERPSIQTWLPGLAAAAWAFAPWEVSEGQPVDLVADGVAIEADRGLVHVMWRGVYPLLGEDWSLSQLQLVASVTAAEEPAVEVATPAAPRTLAGIGPSAGAAPAAASLFDTDDGEDAGTRPLTRKEVLAAMAMAGKALPFASRSESDLSRGAPPGPSPGLRPEDGPARFASRPRADAGKTTELELPPASGGASRPVPPAPPPPAARPSSDAGRGEETRPLPLSRVFPISDDMTMTGDEESAADVVEALPPWLRTPPRPSRDTEVDAEERDDAIADDETHVEGDVPGRR